MRCVPTVRLFLRRFEVLYIYIIIAYNERGKSFADLLRFLLFFCLITLTFAYGCVIITLDNYFFEIE